MVDLSVDPDFILINTRFPHIGKKISFLWGDREFDKMMFGLMNDTRDGARQGFPKDVGRALLRLQMKHSTMFPTDELDVWQDAHNHR